MQLLPDRPLDRTTNKSIDFAYDDLAKSIVQLISVSPKPFTIGLFGKWGTGKSTIIESLKHSLDKRSYVFIKFDVWKYESDALRRSFLIDLAEQLKGKRFFSKIDDKYINRLKKRLYTTTQHSEEKFKLSWRTLIIPLAAIGVIALVYALSKKPFAAALSGAIGFLTIDTLKDYFLDKSNFTQQIFIGEDKVNSPEEFYGEFKKMVGMSNKTLVIVIDNLDRTQKEKTIELLSTVKTFLNADDTNDNVVFIIASDDKAIKEHITSTYAGKDSSNSRFDANEFLKKFFNVTVEIPVFIESEIGNYTKKLLNQTQIPEFKNNTDLQQIINYGYRENPREIKQYINNLAAYYLLLTQGVPKNGLTANFVTNNLNFICKLLITRDKFDGVISSIKEMAIDSSFTWSEIEQRLRDFEGTKLLINEKEREEYVAFSNLTSWCSPSDESISWFFRLRRSAEDQTLPGWDLFVNAAIQQDYENATKLFQDFSDMTALNNQLQTFINSIRNDAVRLTPFFSVYMRILLTLDEQALDALKGSVDLIFLHTPNYDELGKVLNLLDITNVVMKLSSYARPASFNEFIKSLSRRLSESARNTPSQIAESDVIKIVEAVDENQPKLDTIKTNLRAEIERHHSTEAVLSALANKSQQLRDDLVTGNTLEKFFKKIQTNEPEAIQQFAIIGHFNVRPVMSVYFDRLLSLLREINARSIPEEKKEIIEVTYKTLNLQENITSLKSFKDTDLNNLVAVSDMFAGWYGEQPSDKDRAVLIRALVLFAQVPGNTSSNNALDRLTKFVVQAELNEVIELLNHPDIDYAPDEVQIALRERMISYPDQIQELLPFLQPPHVSIVISNISQKAIDTPDEFTYGNYLDKDHKLYPKVSDSEKPTASQHIYNALNSGVTRFPNTVKAYWDKRFISAEQRRELKRLMSEYEASQENSEA